MQEKEIILEKIKLAFDTIFEEPLLLNPEIDIEEVFEKTIKLKMQGFLWGESGDTIKIKYPVDWWEAVKERWFPKWLLKKFPVKYVIHTITPKIIYPTLKISLPEKKHVLKLFHLKEEGCNDEDQNKM